MDFRIRGVVLSVPEAMLSPALAERLRAGQYEEQEARSLKRLLRPGTRVLELGAGAGYLAVVAARITGGENVTVIEANPELIPVIEANLAANEISGVTVLNGAVAAGGATEVTFHLARAFWASSLADSGHAQARAVTVPAFDLASLVATHRPDALMLDIEGAEGDLDFAALPAHVRTVMMELHPSHYGQAGIARIFAALQAAGLSYSPVASRGAVVNFARA